MEFLNLFAVFMGYFAVLDPDPDSGSGYGSNDLIESGSNLDPDPKHCVKICRRGLVETLQHVTQSRLICAAVDHSLLYVREP
jgi:hypothetical protein